MDKMADLVWIGGDYDLTKFSVFTTTWAYALMRETGHSTYYMSGVFIIYIYIYINCYYIIL